MNTSALQLGSSSPGRLRELLITVMICVPTGVVLFHAPSIAPLLVLGILASVMLLKEPQSALVVLLAILILQDPLQLMAGGDSDLALYIKRSDEFLILALGLFCLVSSHRVRVALLQGRLS